MPRSKHTTVNTEETSEFLVQLPMFSAFSIEELNSLSNHMSYIELDSGECLFREGDKGNFMGFVVSGILEVQKYSDSGRNVPIARLTRGSSIGEMALIDQAPRSATVISRQKATLVTFTEKGFELLAQQNPTLALKVIRKIARVLSLNMRRTSSKLADLL